MQINEFLEQWNPAVEYIDDQALKVRFAALRGLSNLRPDLTVQQCIDYANNVLVVNKDQYEALALINPFITYGETSEGGYHDTNSGTDTKTQTDTRKMQTVQTPELETKMNYGKVTDSTDTPTGMKQTDVTDYAYNATAANQPDHTTKESFNNYKDTFNEKLSGVDTQTQGGTNTTVSEVLGGDLKDETEYGHELENSHNDAKKGYVLRDIIELYPEWVQVYDRIVQDIFSVIGSLVATRKIDRRLEW